MKERICPHCNGVMFFYHWGCHEKAKRLERNAKRRTARNNLDPRVKLAIAAFINGTGCRLTHDDAVNICRDDAIGQLIQQCLEEPDCTLTPAAKKKIIIGCGR